METWAIRLALRRAESRNMKLKADLPKQGIREAPLILNAGTVTAILYEDFLAEKGIGPMIRRSGNGGAASTVRSAPPRKAMSEPSS